eukprot:392086-Prymnesium_polylepis.1
MPSSALPSAPSRRGLLREVLTEASLLAPPPLVWVLGNRGAGAPAVAGAGCVRARAPLHSRERELF